VNVAGLVMAFVGSLFLWFAQLDPLTALHGSLIGRFEGKAEDQAQTAKKTSVKVESNNRMGPYLVGLFLPVVGRGLQLNGRIFGYSEALRVVRSGLLRGGGVR
jgi:hypothetical protein